MPCGIGRWWWRRLLPRVRFIGIHTKPSPKTCYRAINDFFGNEIRYDRVSVFAVAFHMLRLEDHTVTKLQVIIVYMASSSAGARPMSLGELALTEKGTI